MAMKISAGDFKNEINVTPLVDVVLVLLIIFMVVTPMLQQGVDVLLPEGAHASAKPGEEGDLVISIRADGTLFLGSSWISEADLPRLLAAEYARMPNRGVVLKADRRLSFGQVRQVMKVANDAKFSQVAILTEGTR
jgi:biopolymer transport protein TolR